MSGDENEVSGGRSDGTDADWERLKAYFAEASSLDPSERARYIERVARDAPELQAELLALLDTQGDPEDGLGAAIASVARNIRATTAGADDAAAATGNRLLGRQLGAYRIIAPIARGGMGEVLRAQRVDGEYEQQVAIKVLGRGALDPDASRRFREERQILARLNHPCIARILDGGTTEDGVSYLVMELIDGQPIDQYVRANALPIREVMQLFRGVCAAVEYAHSNLIVHRDIKPGNILVDASGQPKLLDFGIAKLLQPSADTQQTDGGIDSAPTVASERRMTREYASPEQLLGLPISTASDIYSLGVLLYELLTQCRPRALAGLRPSEVEEVIFNTEPTRPSEALEAQSIARAKLLQGDVDNIVLMALAAEPADRYGSAQQLSADIRRWLGKEPVIARRRSLSYVAGKFLQRNRWWVSAAVASGLVLLGAVLFHVRQIEAERELVKQEALRTSRVAEFLSSLLQSTSPDRVNASEVTARTLLDSARADLRDGLKDQPLVRASLLGTIGRAYSSLALDSDAVAVLEEAVALARTSNDPATLSAQLVHLGAALEKTTDLERARATLEDALAVARLPGVPGAQQARALQALAHVQHLLGEYDASIDHYRQALAHYATAEQQASRSYPHLLTGLGQSLMFADRMDEAIVLMERAVVALQTTAPNDRYELMKFKHNLATALIGAGEDARAEPLLREVVDTEHLVLGDDNPDLDAAMVVLGLLYQRTGRLEEAETLLADALEISLRLRGAQHRYTGYNRVLYGKLLSAQARYAEGEAQFTEALAVYAQAIEPDHPYVASAHAGFGSLLIAAGRPAEAEQQARLGMAVAARALPEGHWLRATLEGLLGMALGAQRKDAAARAHLEAALTVLAPMKGRQPETARLRAALASLATD